MKVIIAPDSFKGSLSAEEASMAMAEGVRKASLEATIISLPVADGGEGTIDVLKKYWSKEIPVSVRGPDGQKVTTSFVALPYDGDEIALVECARSTGLQLTQECERDPFLLNSYGLGEQIARAIDQGYRKQFISLGGSATTDGGIGMLQALGYQFFDEKGTLLPDDRNILDKAVRIDDSKILPQLEECQFTVLCDVTNPFYGKNGAAYVYGSQKGASQQDIILLDKGLENFARTVMDFKRIDLQLIPGSGAAGGLGGALAGILNADMQEGFQVIADLVGLESEVKGADLVLTGEGSLDSQSSNGKVPVSVAKIAEKFGVPVIGLAGAVEPNGNYDPLTAVFSIQSGPCSLEDSIMEAYNGISFKVEQLIRMIMKVNDSYTVE